MWSRLVPDPSGSPTFGSPSSRGHHPGGSKFLERQPDECVGATTTPRDFALTLKNWKDLVRVNKRVNETIKPLSDLEHWGVVERWSYPADGYGDCEDYVLSKPREY